MSWPLCRVVLAMTFLGVLGSHLAVRMPSGQAQTPTHIAPTEPLAPAAERKTFQLPPGFEAQLVAAEPDIQKPMNLAFDAKGRLWVTDSVEYPFAVQPGMKGRDSVKILEDFDATGRARKITTFADGLNIPIGVQPLAGNAAVVFSIPNIWLLKDTDGDGKADERTILFAGFGQNDTHGLNNAFTLWLDGWVYACHGFNNTSRVKGKHGHLLTMHSGNTYRFRADGSRIEPFTFGQVNPFGLSFDRYGDLFSADCHSRPLTMLLRGACYPSFGKPHDGLGFAPEICLHNHGSTGLAGVCIYEADHFPPEYRGRAFIGNVITNRVNQDALEYRGSSPLARELPDFLRSSDPWFRPVDLKLGPDGALYVADFYNRIIGHYEVPLDHPGRDRERGRIWRIVYRGPQGTGASPPPPRDWTLASDEELLVALGNGNLTVRTLATHEVVARGARMTEGLKKLLTDAANPDAAVHALWALERLGRLDEPLLLHAARRSELLHVHVLRILSERASWNPATQKLVHDALQSRLRRVQRAAADALSTRTDPQHLKPLLGIHHAMPADDPQLLHMARIALRNQLRHDRAWAEATRLVEAEPRNARPLADVALGVPGEKSGAFVLAYLKDSPPVGVDLAPYVRHAARHGPGNLSTTLSTWLQLHAHDDKLLQINLLRAVYQGVTERGMALSSEAREAGQYVILSALDDPRPEYVVGACELARDLNVVDEKWAARVGRPLFRIALSEGQPEAARRAAVQALLRHQPDNYAHISIAGQLIRDADQPAGLREACAAALEGNPSQDAVTELARGLLTAPERLQRTIGHSLASTPAGAQALLEAVAAGKASARLLQDRPIAARLLTHGGPKAAEQIATLTRGLPSPDAQLGKLLASRLSALRTTKLDLQMGKALFEKHCAACHQVAGTGGRVGPQLDGIGSRGPERLLEDLLDPSRNLDKAFQLTLLETNEGKLVQGLLLREEGQTLVLSDEKGQEIRVPRNVLRERKLLPISPMPANLAADLPESDLVQLVGYLLRLR